MDKMKGSGERVEAPTASARRSGLLTLPNLLSLSRVLLTPVFVVLMIQRRPWASFYVFLAAGATDALDGFAARTLRLKSTLGLWLDPIGDKILLTAGFVVLTLPAVANPNALPVWLTALCIGRDVAIALGSLIIIALRGKRTFRPTLTGKASTVFQVFLIYAVLYLNAVGRSPQALGWLYVLTALLTAVSWAQYGFIGVHMLREGRVPPAG
ncbi:MAG: CDP-diacylglycerol--glycerol-3-phosphate 3-phosphatidyltransferase [Candidatus Aminicenantes bacterium]|nr:CDP-diacylglycerol--glycerol-3-phosphate 3-phosphatidyltransferase [Candidatus Aminicenantes bacterium]